MSETPDETCNSTVTNPPYDANPAGMASSEHVRDDTIGARTERGTPVGRIRSDGGAVDPPGSVSAAQRENGDLPRVLLCTDHLPPSDGGVEQVVEELARRLAVRGHEVGVYALRAPDERFHLFDDPRVSLFTSKKIDLTQHIGLQSTFSTGAFRDFVRVLSRFDPDVVHTHNRFFFSSYIAWMFRYVERYPLVVTLHLGSIDHITGPVGTAARLFESVFPRRLVHASDSVICVSEAVRDVAQSLGARRAVTAPNAVDTDRFDVAETEFDKRILYVGRLIRNNGPQVLLEAVPDILAEHPDAQFDIVGTGDLRPELEERVASLSIVDSVTFHGFVDDVVGMYEQADLFCRPSYSEGLPLTLLESMATRTVPVVTPVAGAEEVITDGETGHFVGVRDPESVMEIITRLLDRPDEVTRMAQAGRVHVERQHSWQRRVDTIVEEYERVIRDG